MTFSPDRTPDPIAGGNAAEPVGAQPKAPGNFQSYMQSGGGTPASAGMAPEASGVSPLNLNAGQGIPNLQPTMATVMAQASTARDTLGTVEQQLKTPNLKLKRSQAHLLKNKLSDAQGYIRGASEKMGVAQTPMKAPSTSSPLGRFLAYVDDGQNQLVQAQQKLKEMSVSGHQMSPAEMLSVTVKMNLAQQEIEYASNLLAKVITSIRTIMETQL